VSEAAGVLEEQQLTQAGFTGQEIDQWKGQTYRDLTDAGFSTKEVGEYFGVKEPDMSAMKAYFEKNLEAHRAAQAGPAAGAEGGKVQKPAKPADGFLEALEAGWQMSVTGLVSRGQKPDLMLPEDAPRAARIASQVAELAGDVPAMIGGYYAGSVAGAGVGGAAGSAVPVIGTELGAMVGAKMGGSAGAFAAPAAMREILMQHYEKGDIKDFSDFWERSSAVFWSSLKAGVVGAATGGAGIVAGKALTAAPALLKATGQAASEVATMVGVGKALEGQMPNAQDFIDAAILVGGLHGVANVSGKLRTIYAKTGLKPEVVAETAANDPVVKQELASSNVEIPRALQSMVEASPEGATRVELNSKLPDPTKEAPPAEPAATPTAQEKILSQIGEKTDAAKPRYSAKEAYTDFVDRLDPINEAVKHLAKNPESLPADEHPYQLARMANDFKAKTKHVVENGTLDFKTLTKNGESLGDILEPHKDDLDGLQAFLVSKRALEVEGRGLKSGFDLDAAREVVKAGEAKFGDAAKRLVDFQNRNLQYLKDSGVLSEKSYKSLVEAGKSYVPFSRIIETEPGAAGPGKANALKGFKGSDKQIQSPILSILENTETLMKAAEKNRAIDSFVRLAEAVPDQALIEKVKTPMAAIEVKTEEIAKFFKEQGIDADPEALTIFRSRSKQLAPNEFEVIRDGKREIYSADPALAQAFKALDGDPTSMHFLLKLARGITAVKKFGISMTPDFALRNVFRDQMTSGVLTKERTTPLDMISALGDLMAARSEKFGEITGKTDETYYNWLKSGGANGTFLELNDRYLTRDLLKLDKETGFISQAWNVAKKPIELMRIAAELGEQSTRLAEFKNVSKGQASGPDIFAGGYAAREVTVDFQRMGARMSALNSITAFLNANVQGVDRAARAIKEDPAGIAAKGAAYITLPSVLLWWANKDDPRWRELPPWQKDLFWIVLTKDHIYRIPKPQELGVAFGSMPERVLEKFFTDNPNAMKDFDKTMTGMVLPNMIPDAIAPAIEQYFNKSLFTGHTLVPHQMEKILPEYQYTEYTTESAKMLGSFVAAIPGGKASEFASPVILENYARAWSGTLGMYALQMADKALTMSGAVPDPVKPASTLAEIPAVKAFVIRYPSSSAESIQEFQDTYAKHKQVIDTIRYLARSGDFKHMERELTLNQNQDKLIALDGLHQALGNQNRFVQLISKNPEMKPEEKRQMIDGIYTMMIEQAKLGNQLSRELEKTLRGTK
jgi:hypothetical protein